MTPNCDHKGGMVPRPKSKQTREQIYCGEWFDCPFCHSSLLIMSDALKALYGQAPVTSGLFAASTEGPAR